MQNLLSSLSALVLIFSLSASTVIAAPQPSTPNPQEIIQNVIQTSKASNEFNVSFRDITNTEYLWWLTDDDYNILIPNATKVEGLLTPEGVTLTSTGNWVFTPNLIKFIENVDQTMARNGFTLDAKNSSQNYNDQKFYDFIHGYKRNDMVCTLTLDADSFGAETKTVFNFACDTQEKLQESYREQVPLLDALGRKGVDGVVVRKDAESGDFVGVNANFRRTGYYAILKKIDSNYTKIFEGQDLPPCDLMRTHNVPREIYGGCYEE